MTLAAYPYLNLRTSTTLVGERAQRRNVFGPYGPKAMGTSYDAVVLDNDGVLTTPTDRSVLLEAITSAFETVGVTDPADDHVETLLSPTRTSLRRIASEHDVEPTALWEARERAAIEAQLEELRAERKRPYADVAALETLDVPTAIVSNNQHETISNILDHCELGEFETWYGREPTIDGIDRKKPRPHYLDLAVDDLEATNPLYVGDSQVDVVAADAAGIDSAFLRRENRLGTAVPTDPAPEYEIDSLEDLSELLL